MSRFQFVADHRDAFEVKSLCEVVEVARSSFYAWCAAAEGVLCALIGTTSKGTSGECDTRSHV